MSFHSAIAAVWPADLVTAGVVTTASQVTFGRRRPDKIDSRGMVWIERMPQPTVGSTHHVRRYVYRVHVFATPLNLGPAKDGAAQLTSGEAKAQTIVQRYHGVVPFLSTRANMLPATAEEETIDDDPPVSGDGPEGQALEVIVRVTLSEWE